MRLLRTQLIFSPVGRGDTYILSIYVALVPGLYHSLQRMLFFIECGRMPGRGQRMGLISV